MLSFVPLLCDGQVMCFLPKYYECLAQGKYWSGACPNYRRFVVAQIEKSNDTVYVTPYDWERRFSSMFHLVNSRKYIKHIIYNVNNKFDTFHYCDTSVEYIDHDSIITLIAHYPNKDDTMDFVSRFGTYKIEHIRTFDNKAVFIGNYQLNDIKITFDIYGKIHNHPFWRTYKLQDFSQYTLNGVTQYSNYGNLIINIITLTGKHLTYLGIRSNNKLDLYTYKYVGGIHVIDTYVCTLEMLL